jgi:hypothetical protein
VYLVGLCSAEVVNEAHSHVQHGDLAAKALEEKGQLRQHASVNQRVLLMRWFV